MGEKESVVKWFSEIKKEDVETVGDKAAVIGELYNQKFPVSPGFVLTFKAYSHFMGYGGLKEKINFMLDDLNIGDKAALKEASQKIIELIEKTEFHKEVEEEIQEAYNLLDVDKEVMKTASAGALSILKNSREPVFVAIRNSIQKESKLNKKDNNEYILNVKGFRDLIGNIKKAYSSLFKEQEIFYRLSRNIENIDFSVGLVIQKMVNADKSGIIYSHSNIENSNNVVVEAIWGLGVGVKEGIKSDSYVLKRENMEILSHDISTKEFAVTRDSSGSNCTVKLTPERATQQTLTNHEIKMVAQMALKIEEHMKKPQKVEFCIANGEILIMNSEEIEVKQDKKLMNSKELTNEDIEKKILKELEGEEYRPGAIREKDEDMPKLNDAILVDEQQEMDDENKVDLV